MSLTTHTRTLLHILVFLLFLVNINPWVVLAVDPDSRSSENSSSRSGSSVGNAGSSGAGTAGGNNGGSNQSPTAVGPGAGGEPDTDIDGMPDSAENDQAASAVASINSNAGKSGISAKSSEDGRGTFTIETKEGKTYSYSASNQAELGRVQNAVKEFANAASKNMEIGKDINFEKSIECGCVVGALSGAKSTDVGRDRQAIGVDGVAAKEIEVATAKGAVDATLSGYFGAKNAPADGSVGLGTGGAAVNTTSISPSSISGWNNSSKMAVTVVPNKYFDGKYGEYTENSENTSIDIKNDVVLSEKETTVKEKMEQAKEDLDSYLDVPDQYSVAPAITNLEGVVNIGQTINDALAKNPDAVSDRIVDAYAKHADTVSYNAALTHADNQIEAKSNEIDAFTNSQFSYSLANPTDESAANTVQVLVDTSRSYTEAATFARESQAYNASIQGTNIVSETISALATVAGKSRMAENEAYYNVMRQAYENKIAPTEKTAQALEEQSLKYDAISSLSGKIGRTYNDAKNALENNDELGVIAAAKTANKALSMISIVDNPVASIRAISDDVTSRNLKTATGVYDDYATKAAVVAITNPSTYGIQTEGIEALSQQFKEAYAKSGLEGITEKASELNALARAENPGSFINISPTVTTNTAGKSELSINLVFGINYAERSSVTSGSVGLGQIDSNDEASVVGTPNANDASKNLGQSQDISLASSVVDGLNNVVSSLVSLAKSFFE